MVEIKKISTSIHIYGVAKMCFFDSKPPQDNSAELARQKEQQRLAKIAEGRTAIDKQFLPFDDQYFSNIADQYNSFYSPQLEDQYADARRKSVLGLARTGNLNSSAGARSLGDLEETFQKNRTLIGDRALGASSQARSDVENARSSLYAQNRSAASPADAATSALARAGALSTAPQYNPLGNVFADAINNAATGIMAERNGFRGFNTGLFSPNKSSAKVIT